MYHQSSVSGILAILQIQDRARVWRRGTAAETGLGGERITPGAEAKFLDDRKDIRKLMVIVVAWCRAVI